MQQVSRSRGQRRTSLQVDIPKQHLTNILQAHDPLGLARVPVVQGGPTPEPKAGQRAGLPCLGHVRRLGA